MGGQDAKGLIYNPDLFLCAAWRWDGRRSYPARRGRSRSGGAAVRRADVGAEIQGGG